MTSTTSTFRSVANLSLVSPGGMTDEELLRFHRAASLGGVTVQGMAVKAEAQRRNLVPVVPVRF
jgi:hypothetical protein